MNLTIVALLLLDDELLDRQSDQAKGVVLFLLLLLGPPAHSDSPPVRSHIRGDGHDSAVGGDREKADGHIVILPLLGYNEVPTSSLQYLNPVPEEHIDAMIGTFFHRDNRVESRLRRVEDDHVSFPDLMSEETVPDSSLVLLRCFHL